MKLLLALLSLTAAICRGTNVISCTLQTAGLGAGACRFWTSGRSLRAAIGAADAGAEAGRQAARCQGTAHRMDRSRHRTSRLPSF